MKVVSTVRQLQHEIEKSQLNPVGFVPTMGALHEGHLSLAGTAMELCPLVVISIYVNPTQFNDKNDLSNYPRTLDSDLTLLRKIMRDSDLVFTPDDKEIYPGQDNRKFSFGNLDLVMEATHRPGHFNGVGQVVNRLFDIVKPDIAVFGLKDFQQVAVVKELVRQTGNKVKIIGNPIVRETDGLAMSSRNMLLEPDVRKSAPAIFKTISEAARMFPAHSPEDIRSFVTRSINSLPRFSVEYFDIVDDEQLIPVETAKDIIPGRRYFGCVAVKAGNIRLIDNVEIGLV